MMSLKTLYLKKYYKYKTKYLNLKNQLGGIHTLEHLNNTVEVDGIEYIIDLNPKRMKLLKF